MLTILKKEHLDLFLQLKEKSPGIWKLGKTYDSIINPTDFFIECSCDSNAYSVGWIENNEMFSMATLYQFPGVSSWAFLYWISLKSNYLNYQKFKSNLVVSEIFQESFRRKLSSCVKLERADSPTIYDNVSPRMKLKLEEYKTQQIPEMNLYYWLDEAKIPPNSKGELEYINFMMGYKTWPIELRLRAGVLKQEHRHAILFNQTSKDGL